MTCPPRSWSQLCLLFSYYQFLSFPFFFFLNCFLPPPFIFVFIKRGGWIIFMRHIMIELDSLKTNCIVYPLLCWWEAHLCLEDKSRRCWSNIQEKPTTFPIWNIFDLPVVLAGKRHILAPNQFTVVPDCDLNHTLPGYIGRHTNNRRSEREELPKIE